MPVSSTGYEKAGKWDRKLGLPFWIARLSVVFQVFCKSSRVWSLYRFLHSLCTFGPSNSVSVEETGYRKQYKRWKNRKKWKAKKKHSNYSNYSISDSSFDIWIILLISPIVNGFIFFSCGYFAPRNLRTFSANIESFANYIFHFIEKGIRKWLSSLALKGFKYLWS